MVTRLGDKVQDTVTGFTGIVTARTEYLHGTACCLVESRSSGIVAASPAKGSAKERILHTDLPPAAWFDEPRLEAAT